MTQWTSEQIAAADRQYHMPAYRRFDVDLVSGDGATAMDAHGREYIDFGSGIGVNTLGYCDEGWVAAVAAQAATLQNTSNLYRNAPQAMLALRLCTQTGYSQVFFCNSGAEANECAIKAARKHHFDRFGAGRHEIITLENSFHGRTVTTLAATGQEAFHQYFFPFTEGFCTARVNDLAHLESKITPQTCAVMLEFVQGEGGVVPLEPDYVKGVADLCKKHGLLLIADEVQTGMGRTGRLLACEHYDVTPDITTLAKGLGGGLPIGACLFSEEVRDVLGPGTHGTTYGGNPVVAAGALYVLECLTQPGFLERVSACGDKLKSRLAALPGVTDVHGLGMMLGADLAANNAVDVAVRCAQQGLLVLTAKTRLRLLPPLTVTDRELDRGLDILAAVLQESTHTS